MSEMGENRRVTQVCSTGEPGDGWPVAAAFFRHVWMVQAELRFLPRGEWRSSILCSYLSSITTRASDMFGKNITGVLRGKVRRGQTSDGANGTDTT